MRLWVEPELGRLARWLRLLGLDAPASSGRRQRPPLGDFLLSRRRALEGRAGVLVLTDDHLAGQLRTVLSRIGPTPDRSLWFTRCLDCNLPVEPVDPAELPALVPEHVLYTAPSFSRCPGCGKVFWPGSHGERAEKLLAGMLTGRGSKN